MRRAVFERCCVMFAEVDQLLLLDPGQVLGSVFRLKTQVRKDDVVQRADRFAERYVLRQLSPEERGFAMEVRGKPASPSEPDRSRPRSSPCSP